MTLQEQLEQLRSEITEREQRLRDIHAAAETRALDDTEQADWDQILAELNQKKDEARKLAERIDQMQRLAESGSVEAGADQGPEFMRRVAPWDGTDVRALNPGDAQSRAQKAIEQRELTSHLHTAQLDKLSGLLRTRTRNTDGAQIARRLLLTESDAYRRAFMKSVAGGARALDADEARAVEAMAEWRAMSIGTDTAGGFGVPVKVAA